MTIEDRINLVKDLIKKREEIDHQLAELFNGGSITKKTNKCGNCGQEGHSTRTCANKDKSAVVPEPTGPLTPAPFMSL